MIFQTKTGRLKNKKGKYDLLNLEIIYELACKFAYYKKQKISEHLCRHCKFQNERPFPGLRGTLKSGCSLNFSTVKRGAHLKGAFI